MEIVPIITAVISGASAAIAAIAVAAIQHRKTVALLEYRLKQLEEKVDKHNNLIERTYELEKTNALHQNALKVLGYRIENLERMNNSAE